VDKIQKLSEENLELEKVISGSPHLEKSESSTRLSLNDKLEELLLEHVSLKKQLQNISSKVRGDKEKSPSPVDQNIKDSYDISDESSDPIEPEVEFFVNRDLVAKESSVPAESAQRPGEVLHVEPNKECEVEERTIDDTNDSSDQASGSVSTRHLESKGKEGQDRRFCEEMDETPSLSSGECAVPGRRSARAVDSFAADSGSTTRNGRVPSESSNVKDSTCRPPSPEILNEKSPRNLWGKKQNFSKGKSSCIVDGTEDSTPRTRKNGGDHCSRLSSSPGQQLECQSSGGQLDQLASATAVVRMVEEPTASSNQDQSPSTSPGRLGTVESVGVAPASTTSPLPFDGDVARGAEGMETSAVGLGDAEQSKTPERTSADSEAELGSAEVGDSMKSSCSRKSGLENTGSFSALDDNPGSDSSEQLTEAGTENTVAMPHSSVEMLGSVSETASKLPPVSFSQQSGSLCLAAATVTVLSSTSAVAAASIPGPQSSQAQFSSGGTAGGVLPHTEVSLQPWPVSSLLSDSSVSVPIQPPNTCFSSSHPENVIPMLPSSSTSSTLDSGTSNIGFSSDSGPSGSTNSNSGSTTYALCSNQSNSSSSSTGPSDVVSVSINSAMVLSAYIAPAEQQTSWRKPGNGADLCRSGRRRGREVDPVGVAGPCKIRRAAEIGTSQNHLAQLRFSHPCDHHLPASDGHRHFYANSPSSNIGSSQRSEGISTPECSASFSSSSLGLDFRHCRTFATTTSTLNLPAPPLAGNLQQFPGGVSPLESRCHQESSSAIIQPWVDHAHNQQARPSQFSQQQHCSSPRGRRMVSEESQERANGRLEYNNRSWRIDGQSQSFPLTTQHPVAPPPPLSLPLPPQNLDPQHHIHGGPFFQLHDYDPWPLTAGEKSRGRYYGGRDHEAVRESWNSRSSQMYPQQQQQQQPNPSLNDARQFESFVSLQRCYPPGSFLHEQGMPCDTMTPSSFPGVWRPYSESGSPQRGGFSISSNGGSLGQSLPPPPLPPPSHSQHCLCGSHSTAVSPRHRSSLQAATHASSVSPSPFTRVTPPSRPARSLQVGASPSHPHLEQPEPQFLHLDTIPAGNTQQNSHQNEPSSQEQQHTLQMVPTQPTSRTESFFVDRLLYDIG